MRIWFAVHLEGKKIDLVNDSLPDDYFAKDEDGEIIPDENFIDIAYLDSQGIFWEDPVAKLLDDNTLVYPVDGSKAHGIYTIGDLKKYKVS